jgi:hypothetical protein
MARHLESAVGIYNTSIDNLYLDETIELSHDYQMPSKQAQQKSDIDSIDRKDTILIWISVKIYGL